jgi:hypothetical protein
LDVEAGGGGAVATGAPAEHVRDRVNVLARNAIPAKKIWKPAQWRP